MTLEKRRALAYDTTISIINGFSESVKRAAAIFQTPKEAMENFIMPEIEDTLGVTFPGTVIGTPAYTGERRDLRALMGESSWDEALKSTLTYTRHDNADKFIKPGDYIDIPVDVKAARVDGCDYEAIHIEAARMVVTHVFPDKIALNFEDVIFYGPMNSRDTNAGGFQATALSKYLNTVFLPAVFQKIEHGLARNRDGLRVSVPTHFEVFGKGEIIVNWEGDAVRHKYFEKCQNRIKVGVDDKDDTKYWWNYDPYATNAATFCYANGGGGNYGIAGYMDGGVSPAICLS